MKFCMKKISAQVLLCLSVAAVCAPAMATDSTINITGKVVATSCTVAPGQLNVVIPDVDASVLADAAGFSSFLEFAISVTGCPATTTAADVSFNGTASHADFYKNTGTAQNVDVELTTVSGQKNMGPGKVFGAIAFNATTHDATINLKTRIRNGGDGKAATPGTVISAVQMTLAYR